MNGLSLSFSYLRHSLLGTFLNVVIFASGVAVIVALLQFTTQMNNEFTKNLRGIDLVVGAKGSPLQLILSSVFHLDAPTGNIPLHKAEKLERHPLVADAIPLALGDNVQGFRIVGTTPGYARHYNARMLKGGRFWNKEMEAVLGAEAARKTGLRIGDSFAGSHGLSAGGEVHDAFPYTVVGILAPTGSVIDRLALTGIESVWHVHEHHHHDRLEGHEEHHEEHEHEREITALLITYKTPMAAAAFPREINASTSLQAASPAAEVARLNGFMGTSAEMLRSFGWYLITLAGAGIFVALYRAMNERRYDLALMRSFGASPAKLSSLVVTESLILSVSGTVLGIALGHVLVAATAGWLAHARHLHITGSKFLIEELHLLLAGAFIGVLAGLIPALRVRRIDIFKTLATR